MMPSSRRCEQGKGDGSGIQMVPGNETLIFQHIPKTAGTTLSFILTRYFAENDIYHIRNLDQMGGPAFSRHFGSMDDFIRQSPDARNRFRLILGHMPFGIHAHLNNPFNYITFVRDPVDRVISQYGQYIRMITKGELRTKSITLEQFLEERPNVLNNHQIRFLCGPSSDESTPLACYEKALENLNQYYLFVGVVETFDTSLVLLSKLLNCSNIKYVEKNVGRYKPASTDIHPATLDRIRDANQMDMRLHQHVIEMQKKQIEAYGKGFGKDLQVFRTRQIVYQQYNRLKTRISALAKRVYF